MAIEGGRKGERVEEVGGEEGGDAVAGGWCEVEGEGWDGGGERGVEGGEGGFEMYVGFLREEYRVAETFVGVGMC